MREVKMNNTKRIHAIRKQWITNAGLEAFIIQQQRYAERGTSNVTGWLCGYVCMPKEHKRYGKPYDKQTYSTWKGITYSEHAKDTYPDIVQLQDSDCWVIGFDCAHAFDLYPDGTDDYGNDKTMQDYTVCDEAHVTYYCEELANSIKRGLK